MASERVDSLEGWVAIKGNLFDETEKFRLGFLAAWNEVEGKFAVTCHNRTLQRQRGKIEAEASDPDQAQTSWAGLYTPQDLRNLHRHWVAVSGGALEPCFPALPELRPRGLWGLLFPGRPLPEEAVGDPDSADSDAAGLEHVCRRLELYLGAAVDLCGGKIVLDSLFSSGDGDQEEYFENLHEFRKKSLEEQVTRGRESLRKVLNQHNTAKDMVALRRIYHEEDEAYQEMVTVAMQYYQYLLQPFRDMREFALLYKQEILKSLEFDELGPKRIESLQRKAAQWSKQVKEAVCSIQDITVDYFKETVKALTVMQKQMEQDRNRFGKAAWAAVVPRLEKLKFMLAKETLQHMRAKELCLTRKKGGIRSKMECLDQEESTETVDVLELRYYQTQLELYAVQLETLKFEEQLLVVQLDAIRRQINEKEEEVVYYDTCEEPAELRVTGELGPSHDTRSHEIKKLQLKTHQLEVKRGRICARRSYLRNKRDQCEESQKLKEQQHQMNQANYHKHHSIQQKRDEKKEEDKKKWEFVNQERQRTLDRLRMFKEKSPGHVAFKPPRCQPPSVPMRDVASTQNHCAPELSEQPLSIIDISPARSRHQKPSPRAKASKKNLKAPNELSVQIFLPATVPTANPVAIPPPPPPPPPPPLLPPTPLPLPRTILDKKISAADNDRPQPLIAAEKSPKANLGSMDAVLASLKRGQSFLKKVDLSQQPAVDKPDDPRDNMLNAIRQGVQLRKVKLDSTQRSSSNPANELERSIKAAMARMKKVSSDSDSEDHDEYRTGEWDS